MFKLTDSPEAASSRQAARMTRHTLSCKRCGDTLSVVGRLSFVGNDYALVTEQGAIVLPNARAVCSCGNALVKVVAVKGSYSAALACGARCMASKGPDCTCSCGGKNHGAGFSACA